MCAARIAEGQSSDTPSQRTEEIARIAADLFESRGYSATTMADIADAVGIYPGSLYHHFASKEGIALEILRAFDRDLDTAAAMTQVDCSTPPEERLVRLTYEVMKASFANAGAVRLRGYDAPSIATGRLHDALKAQAPTFERAWKTQIGALTGRSRHTAGDLALLRFALRSMALGASLQYSLGLYSTTDGLEDSARELCDALLHGLAIDCPDDTDLDRSEATAAVKEAMQSWPSTEPDERADDVRGSIIAAARTEFARRGYDSTTIRDIANASGVTMGSLYRRVDSKEAILNEVIESYAACLDTAVRAALTTGSSPVESLDALARVFVRARYRFREESDIVKFAWRDRTAASNPIHDYYGRTEERFGILTSLVADGVAQASIRPVAVPAALATHVRMVLWLPFRDYRRTSEVRALRFLRASLLRGFLE